MSAKPEAKIVNRYTDVVFLATKSWQPKADTKDFQKPPRKVYF